MTHSMSSSKAKAKYIIVGGSEEADVDVERVVTKLALQLRSGVAVTIPSKAMLSSLAWDSVGTFRENTSVLVGLPIRAEFAQALVDHLRTRILFSKSTSRCMYRMLLHDDGNSDVDVKLESCYNNNINGRPLSNNLRRFLVYSVGVDSLRLVLL